MHGPGERYREGVSKDLGFGFGGNLGLKIFGDFDLKSSTRRHLRWGGRTLRAFRRPHLGCLEPWSWEVSKNQGRILIFKFPNPPKSSFGGVWEACLMNLGCLEQSWCVLGVSGMRLGCVLERLESILEVSWGHLGAS